MNFPRYHFASSNRSKSSQVRRGQRWTFQKGGTVNEKAARGGKNPQTGDEITIPPRRVLTFRASPVLKNKINEAKN